MSSGLCARRRATTGEGFRRRHVMQAFVSSSTSRIGQCPRLEFRLRRALECRVIDRTLDGFEPSLRPRPLGYLSDRELDAMPNERRQLGKLERRRAEDSLNSNSSHVPSLARPVQRSSDGHRRLIRLLRAHPRSRRISASGMRIEFPTRKCPSFPALQRPYTVAVHTRRRSAASFTVSNRSTLTRPARRAAEVCSTGAANGELTGAIPCCAWTRPPAPTRALPTLCERLLLSPNTAPLTPEP